MTIKQPVYAALSAILSRTAHAVELPQRPTWPAVVFDIDTHPEATWVMGGGYDQHVVAVVIFAKALGDLEARIPLMKTAMRAMPGYMADEESGDAEYEGRPGGVRILHEFQDPDATRRKRAFFATEPA
jgi:hypothetical protein